LVGGPFAATVAVNRSPLKRLPLMLWPSFCIAAKVAKKSYPRKSPLNSAGFFVMLNSVLRVTAQLGFGSLGQVWRQEVFIRVVVGFQVLLQGS
jgi:hypothetical protein